MQYKTLVKTINVTVAGNITDLVEKGVLNRIGEGRSRKYLVRKV